MAICASCGKVIVVKSALPDPLPDGWIRGYYGDICDECIRDAGIDAYIYDVDKEN